MSLSETLYWRDLNMPEPPLEPDPDEDDNYDEGSEDEVDGEKLIKDMTPEERQAVLLALVVTCKDCEFYKTHCEGYGPDGFCSDAYRKEGGKTGC